MSDYMPMAARQSIAAPAKSNKDVALGLAALGIRVFPFTQDRKPAVHSWDAATSKAEEVERLWTDPTFLPAILVTEGLCVLDCDEKNGKQGVAAFRSLCAANGIDLSQAFIVETPSGGQHFYFTSSIAFKNSVGKVADGIDVRSLGGCVFAPGAVLLDGRSYRVVQGSWTAIPALDSRLAAFLEEKRPDAPPASSGTVLAALSQPTERDLAFAAGALQAEVAKIRAMRPGDGINDALNKAAHSLGTIVANGSLQRSQVEQALFEAAVAIGYVATERRGATEATIKSGLDVSMTKPRELKSSEAATVQDRATVRAQIEAAKPEKRKWPSPLQEQAYIGIPGEFIRLVEPHTEGDMNALLLAFLTGMGAVMGRSAYLEIGADRHHPNLFSVIVGETSNGRKGTVSSELKRFIPLVDSSMADRIASGLSSGEGLIEHVRDLRTEEVPQKDGSVKTMIVDAGVSDKRLLVMEGELGQALQVAGREGNTLSATLREAWDGKTLRTLARSNKNCCREPHISIFGNITVDELQRLLTATDRTNGFANRFLWVCAERSKLLPTGGKVDPLGLTQVAARTQAALQFSKYLGACTWTREAEQHWLPIYTRLTAPRYGLLGAMTARAESQVIRLALIYALLDMSRQIAVQHLNAAVEVWRYCEESCEYVFGTNVGSTVADEIVQMLTGKQDRSATLTEISKHFQHNKSREELQKAIGKLKESGKVKAEYRQTGGRPSELISLLAA